MKRMIAIVFFAASLTLNAGVSKVASYPVRHPVKTVEKGAHVVFFPVLHPVRSARLVKRAIW